ncbi:MAG: DUF305 domain-containing protein [Thermomicrobiales bacterium]
MKPVHSFGQAARACMIAAIGISTFLMAPSALAQHDHRSMETPAATPTTWSCGTAGTPAAPTTSGHDMGSMNSSTPAADVEFDQLYIDMMLPHHGSIIALAEVALPRLTDPRLKAMAQNIIDTQSAEQAELTGYREAWYGSGEPDMSEHSMMLMAKAMPGMGSTDAMMQQMDSTWQVATFCAAADPDLAFIEQVIPHHQMAIDTSRIALEKAVHPETKVVAEKVIAAQQTEIDALNQIKAELTGQATPAS